MNNEKNSNNKNRIINPLRLKLHEVIFEAETKAGKTFDVILLWIIVFSIITVMLESVQEIESDYGNYLRIIEWTFTIIFTIEYFLRIISIGRGFRYIFSFMGIVDFLAIIPTYISFFIAGTQFFLVIRVIRLLRVFRIFKLTHFIGNAQIILEALKASFSKITVFLFAVLVLVTILGTSMYLIEGPENGFSNIPKSIYWSIVTLTTVGYGDITPKTFLGQALSSVIMITGYSIIAVPTGIVSVELNKTYKEHGISTQTCINCYSQNHDIDAKYCKYCGKKL
ncbi:MAG: ion transporter [Clostridiales bacterium]